MKTIGLYLSCFMAFSFGHAQNISNSFNYINFDGAHVEINLQISDSFLVSSNQNWYDVADLSTNSDKNYISLVQNLFFSNKDSLKFIYDMFEKSLPQVSDEYFINTVIKFVQFIPYKIPPLNYKGKETSGLFAPAICLSEGYGDCDTKSLLLCCILAHKYELIYLMGANHAFIGIKSIPGKDQEYVEINNSKYVLCEMTYQWDLGKLPISSVYDINSGKYSYIVLKY